jgi:predicted small metal-binding protein
MPMYARSVLKSIYTHCRRGLCFVPQSYQLEATMARKYIDCREFPNEANCTLAISGTEQEVLDAAVMHAVSVHGHENAPELRETLRGMLKDAPETRAAAA